MSYSTGPQNQTRARNTMDRKRVIVWMTVAVAVILFVMTTVLLGALPPWPVWVFFGLSHGFFCAVVWNTKPYTGPHQRPLYDTGSQV
ncbi:MAG: hypothetical protein P8L79_07830 [Rhodospirillaceae bacterium]|nr:hypothetical protein [Rhodospirillaceae bacterium]